MDIVVELRRSGVYQVRNLLSGRVYIGSSTDLRKRGQAHRSALNTGKHKSRELQSDWDRLGASAFVFEIIEFAAKGKLLESEQFWIDWHDANQAGYNVCPNAGTILGHKATEEAKQNISASLGRFYGTEEGRSLASKRAKDKPKKGRGAANENHHKALCYRLTSPDGIKYEGKNVRHFARQMKLNSNMLARVVGGELICYKGWILTGNESYFDKPGARHRRFQLRSPDGTIHVGRTVNAFAKHHGLSSASLSAVLSGRTKRTKGWTKSELSEEELASHNVIYFNANSAKN